VAGSGKSTVAKHMSDEWRRDGRLGGCFFFNKNRSEATNTDLFSETIAAQLAASHTQHPHIRFSIIQAIKTLDPTISIYPFAERLRRLVMEPLKDLDLILTIDALDECNERDRAVLLKSLLSCLSQGVLVKIFITSRPEFDIATILEPYRAQTTSLHDPNLRSNQDDIAIFVENALEDFVQSSILEQQDVLRLANRVNCLFILASTACRVIKKSADPRTTLKSLLNPRANRLRHINKLYLTILEKVCQADDLEPLEDEIPNPKSLIREVLQVIIVAGSPVTIRSIGSILNLEHVGHILGHLSSVLSVKDDETVFMLHPTFIEFLQDPKAAGSFYINVTNAHQITAKRCLAVMKKELKFNICRLESSFYFNRDLADWKDIIARFISAGLQYGCVSWTYHVLRSGTSSTEGFFTTEIVDIFSSPYVLYWIEVLSALGKISQALAELQDIQNWLGVSTQ
jgi:hypothetical protein